MKHHIRLLTIALLALVLAACNDTQSKDTAAIKAAAQGYLDATGNYLIDEAAPFTTQNTRQYSLPVLKRLKELCDTASMNANMPAEITIKGVRIVDSTHAYAYFHKHTPIKEQDDSVMVLKENGQWLVDVRLSMMPYLNMQPGQDIEHRFDPTLKQMPKKEPRQE